VKVQDCITWAVLKYTLASVRYIVCFGNIAADSQVQSCFNCPSSSIHYHYDHAERRLFFKSPSSSPSPSPSPPPPPTLFTKVDVRRVNVWRTLFKLTTLTWTLFAGVHEFESDASVPRTDHWRRVDGPGEGSGRRPWRVPSTCTGWRH